jgi:hypothetical protein
MPSELSLKSLLLKKQTTQTKHGITLNAFNILLNVGIFIAHGKSDIQDDITFTINNNDKAIPLIVYNIALFWVDF